MDTWFAWHRNGESGLNNPNTPDIDGYQNAIHWIAEQLKEQLGEPEQRHPLLGGRPADLTAAR